MKDVIRACPLCQWCAWFESREREMKFECRSTLPVMDPKGVGIWPEVYAEDWCGKFEVTRD